MPEYRAGLQDVIAGKTANSFIDGQKGILYYCGYSIHDLAQYSTFEESTFLLLHHRLPKKNELEELDQALRNARALPEDVLDILKKLPRDANAMAMLRTCISALGVFDRNAEDHSEENQLRIYTSLIAKMATIVAAIGRYRADKDPLAPRTDLTHAGNFLYMLNGKEPSPDEARALDVALILHMDHGYNASTFSSRVTISTLSDIYSAITSAIGTLKGPLHGGANQRVYLMLKEIESPEQTEEYVRQKLERKERIMGFGHRVYRVEDPRARHLRDWAARIGKNHPHISTWLDIQQRIYDTMVQLKNLYPNVDFYSATLYTALGIDADLFPLLFAVGRIVGWCAHVKEQLAENRLIRPRAEYIGPKGLEYIPLDKR